MRRKSSRVSGFSSTRIGSRPCSSGSRSEGLARWKAPEAMNRMWSVFTGPCLVATVVPSISGSRSRCTPSRLTSAPPTRSLRPRDLVDLVEEDDAVLLDGARSPPSPPSPGRAACRSPRRSAPGGSPARSCAAAWCGRRRPCRDVAEIDHAHLGAGHAGDLEGRHAAAGLLHLDLDLACRRARRRAASGGTSAASPARRCCRPARPARAPRRRARPWRPPPCACRSRVMASAISTRSRTICSTSRPT